MKTSFKFLVLLTSLMMIFSISNAQMMTPNGKLRILVEATKQQVMVSMAGEYSYDDDKENCDFKIDKLGNFKMVYGYDGTYGPSFQRKGIAYNLILSGKVDLVLANVLMSEDVKDKYGDKVGQNITYTKYYAVFKGIDNKGNTHSFCAEITQTFYYKIENDSKKETIDKISYWELTGFNRVTVPNCYCEDSNDRDMKPVRIPFSKTLH